MMHRLRNNFRLSIITLLGVCAAIGITPFAFYRFASGSILAGMIDALILTGIMSAVVYAWRTGDTGRSGFILAIVACTGGVVVATVQGEVGLFWLYPSLITSFFLTVPSAAILINLLSLAVLVGHGSAFTSAEQMYSFVTTVIVVSSSAYVFARRNEVQRLRLQQLTILDPLTGVKNRRSMDVELELAVVASEQSGQTYAVVVLDLDEFKQINDKHGHSTGDNVLINCAHLIQKNTRKVDQLFRFGGEEFVLLISGAEQQDVPRIVEHVQSELRLNLKSPSGPVTASFGVSLLEPADTADSWLDRADQSMYQAKINGRDQIVYAGAFTPAAARRKTDAPLAADSLK